jgi:hypothetical protein
MASFGDGTLPSRYERMLNMDEPWGPSRHLYYSDSAGWYPITYYTTGDVTCNTATVVTVIDVITTATSDATTLPEKLLEEIRKWEATPAPEPHEDIREYLKQLHREASWEAVRKAREALRAVRDDPGHRVPLQDRHHPYVRPLSKKRVCGGSSRYRVRVN